MSSTSILITCIIGLIMAVMHIRHRQKVKARRAGMFAECQSLLSDVNITQDDVNFPVLTGNYQGFSVKLEPIADHVGYRKLPSLWLLMTVKADIPYQGIFDFLVRPQNIEFFSPNEHLEYQLKPPEHWPQYASLKTDNIEEMPPIELVDKHIALFEDDKTKELLITQKGVRIVYQANQANQSTYRTLRSLAFDDLSLNPERISHLLNTAIAIHQDLTDTKSPNHESNEHHYEHFTELKAACQ